MASRYSLPDLERLAQDAGVSAQEPPARLQALSLVQPPLWVSEVDERRAEQILQEQINSGFQRKPSILTRTRRRVSSYTFKIVTAVLPKAIEEETTGVVQALLDKGGDVNTVKNKDTKCAQTEERSRLLLTAVNVGQADIITLLASQSPRSVQNEALAMSLDLGRTDISGRLLQHQADPNHCKIQFSRAISASDSTVVSLLLQAPEPIRNATLIKALTAAVKSGSLRIVQLLAEAADLNHETTLPAVEEAVKLGRPDLLLAILLYARGLRNPFLDQMVLKTFESTTTSVDIKAKVFEALFYAGAHGDKSAAAFVLALEQQPCFIDLFAKHKVDVNWAGARAVRRAMKDGDVGLVRRVLHSGALRPDAAANALKSVPRNIPAQQRVDIIGILLEANPRGPAVDEQLVFAVQDRVEAAIVMLRSYGASLDSNEGDALIEAIKYGQVDFVRHLLSRSVDPDILRKAFPYLRRSTKLPRRLMTGLLLGAKAAGVEVDAALRDAVCDREQDGELIDLLVAGRADPTFHDLQSFRHAISTLDVGLLRKLLRSPTDISSGAVSALVADIARVLPSEMRRQMLEEVIEADASEDSLSRGLCTELSHNRCDYSIVELLVNRGYATPNLENGKAVVLAALQSNDKALRMLCNSALTTRLSRRHAAESLLRSSLTQGAKAARLSILIDFRDCEVVILSALKTQLEVCQLANPNGRKWPLECFRVLLNAKPNLELDTGETILTVIDFAALPLLNLFLQAEPSKTTIKRALLRALTIADKNDRLEICQAILRTEPSQDALNAALPIAAANSQHDICEVLLNKQASMDYNDHAAIKQAASRGDLGLVNIMLTAKPGPASLAAAFAEARSLQDDALLETMRMILNAGLRGSIVDQYLLTVAEKEEYDHRLVQLLLDNNASVEASECRSVISAATSCKLQLLQQLWPSVVTPQTSTRCFEACLSAGLVEGYQIDILQFLLEQGARGPSLDHALQIAVSCLANIKIPLNIVTLLLSFGADANFQDGSSLCRASEIGRLDAVEALVNSGSLVRARSRSLHHVLRSDPQLVLSRDFCKMIDMLTTARPWDRGYPRSNEAPAFSSMQQEFDSGLRVLLERRPGGVHELEKILDSGCKLSARHELDILAWSMRRTSPKIDQRCVQLLVDRGANTGFVDAETGESTIMIAIRTGKSSLLRSLIRHHAKVSQKDKQGRSPLLLAVQLGDSTAVAELLAASPATDDGSLHQAVRRLYPNIVEILLDAGHDATLPSSYHGLRTPLAELVCNVQANKTNLDEIRDILLLLKGKGADVTKRIAEKPLICLALDNSGYMAQALLRAYLSKCIDDDFNLYWHGRFCYSPTYYVREKLCQGTEDELANKWNVLKAYGADRDVFYAWEGRQPPGAVGIPEGIRAAELLTRQKEEQQAEEEAEHHTRLRRIQELAAETERAKRVDLQQQIERMRALEKQEQENLKLRSDLNRALSNEVWADERSRDLEQRTMVREDRREELTHQATRASAALLQQKRLYGAEQDHRNRIKAQEYVAIKEQVRLQKSLDQSRDTYQENQHQRNMKEITMAKAVPIGAPYLLNGQNSQRVIEYN